MKTEEVTRWILLQFASEWLASLFVPGPLWDRRCLARDCFFLFQKSRHAVGVPFVRVVAERMTQFVADREIKKAHPVHAPLQQQFAAPHRYLCHQRFLDESLAFRIKRKRGAVRIESPGEQNRLPVLGTHQYPRPIPELRYGIVCQGFSQDHHILAALLLAIACVAHEFLYRSGPVWLSARPWLRGECGDQR